MAALARSLLLPLLAASRALADAALPSVFPCPLPPVVLESKLDPPSGEEWPAQCLGLKQHAADSDLVECAAACSTKPTCNVWQLTEAKVCWIADEYNQASNCWGRNGNPTGVLGGQRIQHGTIKVNSVLESGTGYSDLKKVGSLGATSAAKGKERCKHQCYSNLRCDRWMYVSALSAPGGQEAGCYLQDGTVSEAPAGEVVARLSPPQETAGEAITHECSEKESNVLLVMVLAGLVCLALVCGLILAIVFCRRKMEKPTVSRELKIASKKPKEEAVQPLVGQPMLRLPIMPPLLAQQPTVAYAAPTAFVPAPVVSPAYQVVPQDAALGGSLSVPPALGGGISTPPAPAPGGSISVRRESPAPLI